MRPAHLFIVVATVVLSGCVWLGVMGREYSFAGSHVPGEERVDFVLAKNEVPISAVSVDSQAMPPVAEGRDSVLLLLIGATLIMIAGGMRRYGSALGDSAEPRARPESTSMTRTNEISVTRTVSRPL
jgi:hypothetical protein